MDPDEALERFLQTEPDQLKRRFDKKKAPPKRGQGVDKGEATEAAARRLVHHTKLSASARARFRCDRNEYGDRPRYGP
ncbi:hypothetical protein BPTFM16_01100 [Altererythrobacter insulae]|nr:hypothetical protein BPTFM16_01100 [Altererythrobacter insulae]